VQLFNNLGLSLLKIYSTCSRSLQFAQSPLLFHPRNHFFPVLDACQGHAFWYDRVLLLPELPAALLLKPLLEAELVLDVPVLAFALVPLVVPEKQDRCWLGVCDALERVVQRVVDEELGVQLLADLCRAYLA
jgi:hypothetical protein